MTSDKVQLSSRIKLNVNGQILLYSHYGHTHRALVAYHFVPCQFSLLSFESAPHECKHNHLEEIPRQERGSCPQKNPSNYSSVPLSPLYPLLPMCGPHARLNAPPAELDYKTERDIRHERARRRDRRIESGRGEIDRREESGGKEITRRTSA